MATIPPPTALFEVPAEHPARAPKSSRDAHDVETAQPVQLDLFSDSIAEPEADVRADLARAVAARTDAVRIMDDAGKYSRQIDWPASEPAAPYAVYLADRRGFRTLAFDFDAKHGSNKEAAERDALALCAILDELRVGYAHCTSGGGGRHVFVTMRRRLAPRAAADLADALRQTYVSIDTTALANPAKGCIRPPGSRHRNGHRSVVIGSVTEALAVLEAGNPAHSIEKLCNRFDVSTSHRLSHAGRLLLATGRDDAPPDRDHTRSGYGWRLALHMINAGWSRARAVEAVRAMSASENAGARTLGTYLLDGGRFERNWTEALARPARRRTLNGAQRALLERHKDALAADRWRTVGELAEREALRAIVTIAERHQRVDPQATARDLALEVNISRGSMQRALARLVDRGFMTSKPSRTTGTRWTLQVPPAEVVRTEPRVPQGRQALTGCGSVRTTLDASHPAWATPRLQGLGKRRLQLVELVLEQPRTARELADAIGLRDVRSLRRRHLEELEEFGILAIDRTDGTWHFVADDRALAAHAMQSGATRTANARAAEREDEKAQRREQLARWRSSDAQVDASRAPHLQLTPTGIVDKRTGEFTPDPSIHLLDGWQERHEILAESMGVA